MQNYSIAGSLYANLYIMMHVMFRRSVLENWDVFFPTLPTHSLEPLQVTPGAIQSH